MSRVVNRLRFFILLGLLIAVAGATGAVILTHPAEEKLSSQPPRMQLFFLWKHRVSKLMREERFAEAEPLVLRMRRSFPRESFPDRVLGRIYYETGRFSEAAAVFQMLLLRSPGDAVVRNNLGMTLLRLMRYEQSLRELRTAARLKPGEGYVRYNLERVAGLAGIRSSRLPLPEMTPEGRDRVPVEVIVADFVPDDAGNSEGRK